MTAPNSEEQSGKARLLCVDDDSGFLLCVTAVLERAGYKVIATSEPLMAIELGRSLCFDLAILDYDMPDMNGAELACRLKQDNCDLPIILFSGSSSLPSAALEVVDAHAFKGESVELLLRMVSASVDA